MKAGSSGPGKDGKVFKTLRLQPGTVVQLDRTAMAWGCSASAVVERLMAHMAEYGADRLRP